MIAFLHACGPVHVFMDAHTHILKQRSAKVHFLSKISEGFFFSSWLTFIKINALDENKERYMIF